MKEGKVEISVAVITKNEEGRLPACLKSVSFADEIVVLDSGSTDRTVEIAREAGARVFIEQWRGYGPQKQSAVDKCKHDYVLLIDADERLTDDAVDAIRDIMAGRRAEAYSFRRKSFIGDRWIRHCDWWPDRITRLFDRGKCRLEGMVHEHVKVEGRTVALDAVIEHYSFRDYAAMLEKLNIYSDYTSSELFSRGKRVSVLSPAVHGAWMFFRTYIIKRGFMDGFDGLVVSLLTACGTFFKYAKCLEKRRLEK